MENIVDELLERQELENALKNAELVDAAHYTRNMSVRRKKTLAKLFLLASHGIPTVSMSLPHDTLMMIINLLLWELAKREPGSDKLSDLAYDPCRILAGAVERARGAAGGARLLPSRWIVRAQDPTKKWWFIPRDLVTIDTTSARFVLAPIQWDTAARKHPLADKGSRKHANKGGVPPEIAAARAGEDSAHA